MALFGKKPDIDWKALWYDYAAAKRNVQTGKTEGTLADLEGTKVHKMLKERATGAMGRSVAEELNTLGVSPKTRGVTWWNDPDNTQINVGLQEQLDYAQGIRDNAEQITYGEGQTGYYMGGQEAYDEALRTSTQQHATAMDEYRQWAEGPAPEFKGPEVISQEAYDRIPGLIEESNMETYYNRRFGPPPDSPQGEIDEEQQMRDEGAIKARRAASGGSSPWW